MSEHWKEILPIDRYIVHSSGLIQSYDRKVLTFLYQPLIGSLSFSLYMTLWAEMEGNQLWGGEKNHFHLMSILNRNLNDIYQERKKLEGIGLMQTYVKKDHEDVRSFIYELHPPLHPKRFFEDGLLNVYLFNRLGKSSYLKIKQFFTTEEIEKETYTPITLSFNDVYSSLHPSELMAQNQPETAVILDKENGQDFISIEESKGVMIEHDTFDFELLTAGLSENLFSKKLMTGKVKETISKLAFLYRLNPMEMRDLILKAVDRSSDEIDLEELRKCARDWYKFEHGDELPALSFRTQPKNAMVLNDMKPRNKEEELIQKLEIVSPYELLKNLSGGAEPTPADLQMIEEIMFSQKLNPGVINVLIHYVMLRTDMKLSKSYVTKIASHWTRKKIKTVPEAMRIAKSEHRQYQEWAQNKKTNTKKAIRQEVLPKWLKEQKENEVKGESNTTLPEDERMKFEELQKKFKGD